MALLINKDGKQLGPYSLDDARSLVLSGALAADDWAWPDGAKDWILLKDVPGFVVGGKPPPPTGAISSTAAPPAAPVGPEEELWRGHPSQMLKLGRYLFWTLALAAVLAVAFWFGINLWSLCGIAGVAGVAFVHCVIGYLHLRAVEYVVTTQRVRIVSGLFSKDIQEIELFRVKDTMARQSFFLRLFGLGTITITSGDPNHPLLVLSGIPGAIDLRERVRQEVMTLRQRFGVREMDVM